MVHVTQYKWIHCNILLHQKYHSYLDQQLNNKLAKEVVQYLDTDPREVPEESRNLLEVEPDEILKATKK